VPPFPSSWRLNWVPQELAKLNMSPSAEPVKGKAKRSDFVRVEEYILKVRIYKSVLDGREMNSSTAW